LGLVLSLVLTTKASDDPNHDDSVSENPTGRATVHGHPKVAAGSGRQKPISETPLMSSEADSDEHAMPPVMTEDNTMMLSEEVQLTNAHESKEAMLEEALKLCNKDRLHKSILDTIEALEVLFPEFFRMEGDLNKISPLRIFFPSHQGEVEVSCRVAPAPNFVIF